MRPDKRLCALVFIFTALLFVQLVGCASIPPQRQIVEANNLYSSLLESLTDLRRLGAITDGEKLKLEPFVQLAGDALDEMQRAYNDGNDPRYRSALSSFKTALVELAAAEKRAKEKQSLKQKGSVGYEHPPGDRGFGGGGGRSVAIGRISPAPPERGRQRCYG